LGLSQQAKHKQVLFRECGYTPYACYGISLTTTTAAQPHFGKLRDIFKVTQDIILLLLHDGEEIILAELINGWFPNNKLQYNQKDEVSLFAL